MQTDNVSQREERVVRTVSSCFAIPQGAVGTSPVPPSKGSGVPLRVALPRHVDAADRPHPRVCHADPRGSSGLESEPWVRTTGSCCRTRGADVLCGRPTTGICLAWLPPPRFRETLSCVALALPIAAGRLGMGDTKRRQTRTAISRGQPPKHHTAFP